MSYEFFVALLSFLSAFLGGGIALFLGWKKLKPETRNLDSESDEHSASAAESALRTTERATQQLYATMKDLDTERSKRRELQKTVDDLRDQLEQQNGEFETKLANQKAEFEKIKNDLEYTIAKQAHKIEMLVLQIQHLGNTPIENK